VGWRNLIYEIAERKARASQKDTTPLMKKKLGFARSLAPISS
jgi:hypothetical protein